MSPLMSSHGAAAFATAVAVSGTFMLIAFCRQKQLPSAAELAALDAACSSISPPPTPHCGRLRPCISSAERKRERANGSKKKKRRVHFAEEVIEFELDGEQDQLSSEEGEEEEEERRVVVVHRPCARAKEARRDRRNMQANRQALYNGILQDRMQRMTCSY